MPQTKKYIVTHHVPDLDAITSTWLLKTFDQQHYGEARFEFVDPGNTLDENRMHELQVTATDITHVDTGLGEFDHHQADRGQQYVCATTLVGDYLIQLHPDLKTDTALQEILSFVNEIDHLHEIYWPEANHHRYSFMVHELLEGMEKLQLHDDDSLLHFGMTCLDAIYAHLSQTIKAEELLKQKAYFFEVKEIRCAAIETENDDVIKVAQKQGILMVVRKDPQKGFVRIKVRPDSTIDLKPVYEEIIKQDPQANWYYHPSGKMLLNGSSKHRNQNPSTLTLAEVVTIIKEAYVV
jgi:hypothetical protein